VAAIAKLQDGLAIDPSACKSGPCPQGCQLTARIDAVSDPKPNLLTDKSLVIFDCDGVLVDSENITNRIGQALLAEYGLTLSLEQMDELFVGRSTPECVDIVTQLLGHAPPENYLREFARRTTEAWRQQLRPIAGVLGFLETLSLPYCVASNGSFAETQTKLEITGLLDKFDRRIFSGLDTPRPKPAPDVYLHAAKTMGADPSQCLVIEDSAVGVSAGAAAGMTVIGFAPDGNGENLLAAGADRCIDSLQQLLEG